MAVVKLDEDLHLCLEVQEIYRQSMCFLQCNIMAVSVMQ